MEMKSYGYTLIIIKKILYYHNLIQNLLNKICDMQNTIFIGGNMQIKAINVLRIYMGIMQFCN